MMKLCHFSVVVVLVLTSQCLAVQPPSAKFYSRNNAYQGRLSSSGNFYGKNNAYQGRISSSGNIYNKSNSYQGRVTVGKSR